VQRSRSRRFAVLAVTLVIGPWIASSLIAWWAIGDLSEKNGYLQLIDLPQTATAAHIALAGGVIAAFITITAVLVMHRRRQTPSAWKTIVIVATLFGIATAYSFRIMSSRAYGANIGGGGLSILWPTVALALGIGGGRSLWRIAGTETAGRPDN
jgi:di/tricarboxylate transporter